MGREGSFLPGYLKQGHALGVAYLITREQFDHVALQENGGHQLLGAWYNTIISIGMMDGHEVVTITNNAVCDFNAPSDDYLDTLHRGIAENYKDMDSDEIDKYLQNCIR